MHACILYVYSIHYTIRRWIPDVLNGPVSNKMYDFAARSVAVFVTRYDVIWSAVTSAT